MRSAALLAVAVLLGGCGGDAMQVPTPTTGTATIRVSSPAFEDGGTIPAEFTCRGAGSPPELAWSGVPEGARSLALVMSDPDAPRGTFVHWVVYDLPARDGGLPVGGVLPAGAREADNTGGKPGWYPPCPPSVTHHYLFTVHALDGPVSGGSTQEILDDVGRHSLAAGTLTGLVSASG